MFFNIIIIYNITDNDLLRLKKAAFKTSKIPMVNQLQYLFIDIVALVRTIKLLNLNPLHQIAVYILTYMKLSAWGKYMHIYIIFILMY